MILSEKKSLGLFYHKRPSITFAVILHLTTNLDLYNIIVRNQRIFDQNQFINEYARKNFTKIFN